MKKHNVSHWILDSKIEGMLYFAQRINEMLFDYTLDTHKGRTYNSLVLCIEALISIKQIEKGVIKDANIKHIIEELNWSLKQDTVIKHILAEDFDVIIPLLDSDKISNIKPILELISVRVTPSKYEVTCRGLLIKAIHDNKKISIDSYLESWLCIVKLMGYSEEYIYNTANNYFFGTDHTVDSVEYLQGFFDLINFEQKSYDVYVIVDKSLVHIISQSNFNDNSKVPKEYGSDLDRFIAFIVLPEYDTDRKDLFNLLNDFPLLRYRIYSINKKFSTPKAIHDTLSNHLQKLSWHMRRIYRARNSMVHDLSNALFVENIVTNIHSYIDEFVTTLLSLIQKDGKIMTIEQGMQYGALAYAYKMKYIKDVAALTAENYKSILLWN